MVKMEPGESAPRNFFPIPALYFLGYGEYFCKPLLVATFSLRPLLTDDDVSTLQKEILMLKTCRHGNIVAYHGSYLW